MLRRLLGLICAALLAFAPAFASASVTTTGAGKAPSGGGGGYTGPGDIVGSAKAFWSLRAYSAAIAAGGTTKAIKVLNTSTSETCDVLIATSGDLGNTTACSGASSGTAVATFCGANCTVSIWYDQISGGVQNMAASVSNPALAFNCLGTTKPCVVFSGANGFEAGSFSSTAQTLTISAVAIRTSGTAQSDILSGANGTWFSSLNLVGVFFGSAPTVAQTDNAWHALQFVVNNASSTINVDGTANTGLSMGAGALDADQFIGRQGSGNYLTGKIAEVGVWGPALAFSSGQQTSMCHNQFTYWGTSTSC